jgi:ribosome-binding ATPase
LLYSPIPCIIARLLFTGIIMRVGIIGLGQSGKSSLFNTLTGQQPEPKSGKPHKRLGRALIPDQRVDLIARLENSVKLTYAEVAFVDPEGFPPDVGKTLSGEMLNMVRNDELLALVIRAFTDPSVMHPRGDINPLKDLESCFSDLAIADLQLLEGRIERVRREFERGRKEAEKELNALERATAALSEGKFLLQLDLNELEKSILESFELLTLKQGIVVWNVDESVDTGIHAKGAPIAAITMCREKGWGIGAASLPIEAEIAEMDPADRQAFLEDRGVTQTVRDRFLRAVYDRLGSITYFTGGPKEAAARAVPKGSTAYDAAGCIHTDIQKGFIRAEVMSFEDLKQFGTVEAVRKAGKYRLEKKEYPVQDGDIMIFRFA